MPTYKEASAQGTSSVSTYATLYSSLASEAVVAAIYICNTGGADATYRIAIMSSESTPAPADWRAYNLTVHAQDTASIGPFSMQAGRHIRISSSSNTVTFAAEISEY